MGKVDFIKKLYKLLELTIKYKLTSKTSTLLTRWYITVPREYMRDEVVIMATKTSQEAYKIKRQRDEISVELSNYLDGVQ
jgi:outer membrane lipopolysaccharide assembly protein LptE/RlpB